MNTLADKKIQFIDLQAQQNLIRHEIDEAIRRVLEHGKYIMGPEVRELEESLARYVGTGHCISCASGTDALLMALMAHDVGPSDAIFTTPFTFISTSEVIALLGAKPVFVDIDPETFNIDPGRLSERIPAFVRKSVSARAKAIIAVDLFGQPADYQGINKVAREFGLFVVEDAAQSFGAEYQGKKACNLADIATTSFFPAKPLGCYGDGGAVFCQDDEGAERLRSIRIHGKGGHKYDNVRIGINGRLDTLQAAILLPKLRLFANEVALRNKVAARYTQALHDKVKTPVVRADSLSVWAQYSILTENRDALAASLKSRGVPTAIYYPKPLHLQTAFSSLGYKRGEFPISEHVADTIISLSNASLFGSRGARLHH